MGLLDSILGNVFGSRSGAAPPQPAGSSMSPLTKTLLLLLAAKAYQHYRSRSAQPPGGQMPYDDDQGRCAPQPGPGGGMGAGFPGGLGGMFGGGGGLGGALGGGLGGLLGGL